MATADPSSRTYARFTFEQEWLRQPDCTEQGSGQTLVRQIAVLP